VSSLELNVLFHKDILESFLFKWEIEVFKCRLSLSGFEYVLLEGRCIAACFALHSGFAFLVLSRRHLHIINGRLPWLVLLTGSVFVNDFHNSFEHFGLADNASCAGYGAGTIGIGLFGMSLFAV
jgi:hypothetical protein